MLIITKVEIQFTLFRVVLSAVLLYRLKTAVYYMTVVIKTNYTTMVKTKPEKQLELWIYYCTMQFLRQIDLVSSNLQIVAFSHSKDLNMLSCCSCNRLIAISRLTIHCKVFLIKDCVIAVLSLF